MAGVETETEFLGYSGDCVWAAVHMGAHRLAPAAWPLPSAAALNRLTGEAIAAGIGVGPQGQATPGQLEAMLTRWGMRYTRLYAYNGLPIPADELRTLLDDNTSPPTNRPVLLGFTNGQALIGDELGLHGHEIAVVHPYSSTYGGYGCGDGDSPAARNGQLSYYPLDMLVAAQPDSAYVLEEVPGMAGNVWTANADGTATDTAGHHAGTGIAAEILADGHAGVMGLTSETYYTAGACFLALADDTLYTWSQAAGVQRSAGGGQLVATLWGQVTAAQAKAASAPPADPQAAAALALLRTFGHALVQIGALA